MLKQLGLIIMLSLIIGTVSAEVQQASPEQIGTCADYPPDLQKYCNDVTPVAVATVTVTDDSNHESDKYLSSNADNMYGKVIDESDYTPEMRASLEASKAECRQWAADVGASGKVCDSMHIRTSNVTPPQTEEQKPNNVKSQPSLYENFLQKIQEAKVWFKNLLEDRFSVRHGEGIVAVRG